jgi:uncharacterized protein YbbC (DUF1343 family)
MKLLILAIAISLLHVISQAQVKTGLQVLIDHDFKALENKNIGLITNPTGVNDQLKSTIDILFESKKMKIIALFSPEHGVRGDHEAGEYVPFYTDSKTLIPVYSIYGARQKPSPEMLKGIDVLVYDIQDIGSRSYTYISTLGLAMEAAAEAGIEFMVLDRPNPLGGEKIEGPLVKNGFFSFVSQYPIPYIHGLTTGELATFLNEEGLLKAGKKCKLTVIPLKAWKRSMIFEETGLPWVPSSPHIPHAHTPFFYPATGILGELYVMNIGVGYTLPFQMVAAPWIDADSLTTALNALNINGVLFRPVHYKPYYSTCKGEMVHGVQIHITDYRKAPLSLLQFYILQECHKLWPLKNVFELCDSARLPMFDKVCGTNEVRKIFTRTFSVDSINNLWMNSAESYREKVKKYYLY